MIRVAILNTCTTGSNPAFCQKWRVNEEEQRNYAALLRRHYHLYPGNNTSFRYEVQHEMNVATIIFDSDVQDVTSLQTAITESPDLIMFALPHHFDSFESSIDSSRPRYCTNYLLGPTCLVIGSSWTLSEELPFVSFFAHRQPLPKFVHALADALTQDITFTLPEHYCRGAGDTYFSGKELAKLGRILLIAEELKQICSEICGNTEHGKDCKNPLQEEYASACREIKLPSDAALTQALENLRSGVEIWVNGTAESRFLYDSSWGGVVSCGCIFDSYGCKKKFPDCPGLTDPGLNFGNDKS
jgi:endoglucanase Acf2